MTDERMVGQRRDEWDVRDAEALIYHPGQSEQPKASTVAFERFVASYLVAASQAVDLGCGAGAATAHLAMAHPSTQFTGVEPADDLVEAAEARSRAAGIGNLRFRQEDCFDLDADEDDLRYDGVISIQTLSWLPDLASALAAALDGLRPGWFAASSLFHPGELSARIEVIEHARDRRTWYNHYALPEVDSVARFHGYRLAEAVPFDIPIDVPVVLHDRMGTWTLRTSPDEDNGPERLQLSGPLILHWWFIRLDRGLVRPTWR